MQKEENTKLFKPQIYQKRVRGQNRLNFGNRDRSRAFNGDRQRQNFRPNNRGWSQNRQCGNDNRIEETIDIKIIVEMIAETEGDKTLGEAMITEAEVPHQEELVIEDIIAQTQI